MLLLLHAISPALVHRCFHLTSISTCTSFNILHFSLVFHCARTNIRGSPNQLVELTTILQLQVSYSNKLYLKITQLQPSAQDSKTKVHNLCGSAFVHQVIKYLYMCLYIPKANKRVDAIPTQKVDRLSNKGRHYIHGAGSQHELSTEKSIPPCLAQRVIIQTARKCICAHNN